MRISIIKYLTIGLLIINALCIECPEGQTDPGSNVCTSCSIDGCKDCTGDITKCISCIETRFLVVDFGVLVCGYCPEHCAVCTVSTECETCIENYQKSENGGVCKSMSTYPFRYILAALLIPLFIVLLFLAVCCYYKAKAERLSNQRLKIQQLRATKLAKEKRLKYLRDDPNLIQPLPMPLCMGIKNKSKIE